MKMSMQREGKERQPSYSIARLRSELTAAVRAAESGEAVEVTRRGKTVAVLLGLPEYDRLRLGRADFRRAYSQFRERADLESLPTDLDEVFGDVRDTSPGREVDW